MINWWLQSYLSYKGLFLWLNWPAYLSSVFFRPILMVVLFGLVGRFVHESEAQTTYIVVGIAAHAMARILLGGILQCFFYEQFFGTLSPLFSSYGSRLLLFFSRGCLHYPNGLLTMGSCLGFAWLFLDLNFTQVHWPSVVGTVLLLNLSSTAFSLFAGNFSLIYRDFLNTLTFTDALLLLCSGVLIPIANLPKAVSWISPFLPLTHGLEALRAAMTGVPMAALSGPILGEIGVTVGYAIAGYALFRWVEAAARRRGDLVALA